MSQKTILITGSEGLLGSSLVPFLKNLNYNVIRHSRSGSTEAIGDLVDKKIVWNVLDDHTPDFIVNLAAATNVDECERKPNYAYLLNVKILENIVSWIQSKQSKAHLIHVSTDQVYDGKGPHLEENVELTNYYSFSKFTGELVARSVSSTVLRTNFSVTVRTTSDAVLVIGSSNPSTVIRRLRYSKTFVLVRCPFPLSLK